MEKFQIFEKELLEKLSYIKEDAKKQLDHVDNVWKFIETHFDFIFSTENHEKFKHFKVKLLHVSKNNMNEINKTYFKNISTDENDLKKAKKLYLYIEYLNNKIRTYYMNEHGIFFRLYTS